MGTCGLNHGYGERLAGRPIGETDLSRHGLRRRGGDSDRQNHQHRLPSVRWDAGPALGTVLPEEESRRVRSTTVYLACGWHIIVESGWRPCGNSPNVVSPSY